MEKRPPKPQPDAPRDAALTQAMMDSRATAVVAIDAVKVIADRVSVESAASTNALRAITEAVKPRQKIIDVKVTSFNEHGRPASYRITIN